MKEFEIEYIMIGLGLQKKKISANTKEKAINKLEKHLNKQCVNPKTDYEIKDIKQI